VVNLGIRTQRPRQPTGAGIQPLAWNRQQFIERRQRPREQAKLLLMSIDVAPSAGKLARAKIGK
jgi:hypothetical protein